MAFSPKSSILLILLLAVAAAAQMGPPPSPSSSTSSCPVQLSGLNVCGQFVLPGAAAPSSECCSAIKSVQSDCLCSTLQITARLPSLCNLPSLACPAS